MVTRLLTLLADIGIRFRILFRMLCYHLLTWHITSSKQRQQSYYFGNRIWRCFTSYCYQNWPLRNLYTTTIQHSLSFTSDHQPWLAHLISCQRGTPFYKGSLMHISPPPCLMAPQSGWSSSIVMAFDERFLFSPSRRRLQDKAAANTRDSDYRQDLYCLPLRLLMEPRVLCWYEI